MKALKLAPFSLAEDTMMECVYVEEAKYAGGYRVFLRFNNGRSGEVDLQETVYKHAAAAPLREPEAFSQFHLDSWPTLAWDCGFDVAPETLYEKCEQVAALDKE
jgi:hypothetical protein